MTLPHIFHVPVLLPETIKLIDVKKDRLYVDATIGGGGYAFEILERGGLVLGIDKDVEALKYVKTRLEKYGWGDLLNKKIWLIHDNFRNLKTIIDEYKLIKPSGILFDLGMSSYQLDYSGRGFSFRTDESLDMRMDKSQTVTAEQIINTYSEVQLYEIFLKYGEELNSRPIAIAIVRTRALIGGIKTTNQLKDIITQVMRRETYDQDDKLKRKIQDTSARIFQALRINVNSELDNLKDAIGDSVKLLDKGSKLAFLSYHSLEDRIVKGQLRRYAQERILHIVTKKPIIAQITEIRKNPRARSAKLRVAEKII